jgi:hypothetical protein
MRLLQQSGSVDILASKKEFYRQIQARRQQGKKIPLLFLFLFLFSLFSVSPSIFRPFGWPLTSFNSSTLPPFSIFLFAAAATHARLVNDTDGYVGKARRATEAEEEEHPAPEEGHIASFSNSLPRYKKRADSTADIPETYV